jgi:uncharacterized GH25 family protein
MRLRTLAAALLALSLSEVMPAPLAADVKPEAAAKPAATAPKPAAPAVIAGKVSGADGKPLAGATVRAIPMPVRASGGLFRGAGAPDVPKSAVAKTDASGAFKLDGLTGGPFALRAEAPGLAPAFAASVPLGASLDLRLKPGHAVLGRVLDLTTQKPVAGATVTAIERDAARFGKAAAHTVVTADNGTFTIPDCAPGVVTLSAIAPGKARAELDGIPVKAPVPGEEPKFDVHTLFLQPGGRLAGKVVGADGKPLADAVVTATGSDGSLMAVLREGRIAVRSEANGAFSFDGVPAGNKYTLRATKTGFAADEEGPIVVEAGTDRGDLELKLDAGASIAFRLVTADDVPVKDVDVKLTAQGGPRRRGMAMGGGSDVDRDKVTAQGDGKFLVKALEPGTFDLTLAPPDFADISKPAVKLKSGETVDLGTLRVKESKSIAGRIVDATGQPVAGATVSGLWFEGTSGRSRDTKSNAEGRYRLSGLTDEPLRNLWVRAEGFATGEREGATPGDTAVDFYLQRTGSIVGKVVLPGGGVPAAFRVQASAEAKEGQERPGFRITMRAAGRDEEKFFTDPSGHFRLDDVEPGTVTITAVADGKSPARKTGVTVGPDQVADIGTLTLEDGKTLRGRVIAAKDDAPIAGATVALSQPQGFGRMMGNDLPAAMAVSGIDGRFEVSGLETRTYAIDANQPEYSSNSGRVEIPADREPEEFVIHLSKGGTVTGQVRDAAKQPVPNAQVLLLSPGRGMEPQTASAGVDGRYSFEKITPGDYTIIRAPTGGGPLMIFGGMKQVSVKEGEVTVFDLDEASKINVTGRVLKGGQPVPNAMLFFTPGTGENGEPTDLRQSRTDADGRYQVGLDKAGDYLVTVSTGSMFGGGRNATPVVVPDQPNPIVDVPLRAASITGRVVNQDGKAVSGAMVSVSALFTENAPPHPVSSMTEPDGTFEVGGMMPGNYKVVVVASGYRNGEVGSVTVSDERDTPSVDVRLEPGRTARGRVVDAGGNGIAGAMVMAAPAGSAPASRESMPATSDVNGSFLLTVPADGPIDLTAVAAGFPPARVTGVIPQDGSDIVMKAPRGARVRVTVLASDGKPAAGARVSARPVPAYLGSDYLGFLNGPATAGSDGVAVVGSLAPGAYEVVASSGQKRTTRSVTVGEGTEGVEVVTLP